MSLITDKLALHLTDVPASTADIAKRSGLSYSTADKGMRRLVAEGGATRASGGRDAPHGQKASTWVRKART